MKKPSTSILLTRAKRVTALAERQTQTTAASLKRMQERQQELQQAVARLQQFYAHSPLAFVTFDSMACIYKLNAAAETMLGVNFKAVQGLPFAALVSEAGFQDFFNHLRRCRRGAEPVVKSEILLRAGRASIPVQLISCRAPGGKSEMFETALIDLTEQKAAAELLKRSWEFAESIVLGIPYPVLAVDERGRILSANEAFYDIFNTTESSVRNWTLGQLPNVQWSNLNFEDYLLKTVLQEGGTIQESDVEAILISGKRISLHVHARRLRSGAGLVRMLLVCFEDITRRKRVDQEREALVMQLEEGRARLEARVEERTVQLAQSLKRLREVSEQLFLAHESEQRRIARDLHDQVGQDLTALRIMFSRAGQDETNPARQTFLDAEKVTNEAIQNVRNICGTLRPQALDDMGLLAGLKTVCKTFGTRSGLEIEFEHNEFDETRLSPILQSTIFRVIQEALTNVARHAETNKATVSLWMTEHDVMFRIQDRGKGFRLTDRNIGHNGILNMRERISLVNGQYDLKSRPGRGTTIQVQIPLNPTPLTISTSTTYNHGKNHSSRRP